MHLSDDSIQRHLDGEVHPAVGEHLTLCLPCSLRASETAGARVRWERRGFLGRLVRVGAMPSAAAAPADQRRAA